MTGSRISNVRGSGAAVQESEIKGLPEHKLKNISLENIKLKADEAFICSNVESMELEAGKRRGEGAKALSHLKIYHRGQECDRRENPLLAKGSHFASQNKEDIK